MRKTMALAVAALLPLAACDAGGEVESGMEGGLETTPAAETATPVAGDAGLGQWDTDANQNLTRDEWGGWYEDQGVYDTWNTDAQEGLTTDEFGGGIFGEWDADQNQQLTESEWNEGTGTWFGDQDAGSWGEWDANGDSFLDANEFAEGLERENLYDTVDRDSDALIDDEEIADWWFDIWDGNDDSAIDTTEWDQVGSEWTRIGSGSGAGTGM